MSQKYVTKITLTVLSIGPIPEDMTLADIVEESIDGEYSASEERVSTTVTDDEMRVLLVAQHSDPDFLDNTDILDGA